MNNANEDTTGLITLVIPAPAVAAAAAAAAAVVKSARGRPSSFGLMLVPNFYLTCGKIKRYYLMSNIPNIINGKKGNALIEIRKALVDNGHHVDVIDINMKFTSLKSYFSQEKANVTDGITER